MPLREWDKMQELLPSFKGGLYARGREKEERRERGVVILGTRRACV